MALYSVHVYLLPASLLQDVWLGLRLVYLLVIILNYFIILCVYVLCLHTCGSDPLGME